MATQGPLFPGTITTESVLPEDDNNWTNPGNIAADDAAEAQITAATYDAGDISFRLKAQNFGFTIPAGSTINGITVEIERRAFAGGAEDERVQLLDALGALVGDNKAVVDPDWPTTATIRTYGGAADLWNAAPTVAMVNDADFGVVLSVEAVAANTDIGVDFIRVTVDYTPPAVTPTRGRVSQVELEVPLVPTRGRVSQVELEVPLVPTRGRVSQVEFEVPGLATRGRVSWVEFEVPSLPTPTRARVSWVELEVPGGGVVILNRIVLDLAYGPSYDAPYVVGTASGRFRRG